MVNDTFAPPRGKDRSRKETRKSRIVSSRELERESSFHAHCRQIAQTPLELKRLENSKKRERSGLQRSMGTKESERDSKRKPMTAQQYKARYKAQSVKKVVSDTDEAIVRPNTVVKDTYMAGPSDSVDSENSSSVATLQDVTLHSHSEIVKGCRDPKATEPILSPESLSDSRQMIRKSVCSKRKRVSSDSTENDLCSCGGAVNKNLGRLCTCKKRAQYFDESPHEPNADNGDVRNKQRKDVNDNVNPESGHGEPFNERDSKYVSSEFPYARNEIGVKSDGEDHGGNKHDSKILEVVKKCRMRQKKLQRKQQEEIQVFHKNWKEKRDQIDKDLQLEEAFTRYIYSNELVRKVRLERLNQDSEEKIKEHDLSKNVELKNLEAEQLAATNEEKQKREHWLTEAETCTDEPIAVNGPPLIDDNAGVSQLAKNLDATRVVSESTDQVSDKNASQSESTMHFQDQHPNENNSPRNQNLEDHNPSGRAYANLNASALANSSISARVDSVHCDIPTEMKILVSCDFQNQVLEKDMDGSSVDMVEQSNQLRPSCDNGELDPVFENQSVNLTVLTIESSVEVPAEASVKNVLQDEILSSFAEQINQNELAIQNQRDSQIGDPELVYNDTALQFDCELEEGEIQDVELEECEMQEKTMGKQGTVNSETVAIVEPGEQEPIMERRKIVNETVASDEPMLFTEKSDGSVHVLGNQHTSEIQFEKMRHPNGSLTDGQSNVELQDLVTRAEEINSNSDVANSVLVYTVDPAQPISEQPRADSIIGNQNTCVTEAPFSSHIACVGEAEALSRDVSQFKPVQPIKEQPEAEAVGSGNSCHVEAPISIQTAAMTEFETLPCKAASQIISQIDNAQPITEQLEADAETVKGQNTSHIEAALTSHENYGQGPDVNNQAGKTRNPPDKPSRSRSPTPSPNEKHGASCHSSPTKVLRDARESRVENIRSRSPVESSARKRAHRSDPNDLSPSPEQSQKHVRTGSPNRSHLYGGRDIERNNYSSRARFERSPQGRSRCPADDDCSTGTHDARIGSKCPIAEQPLADAETVENQNTCLIQAPISIETANVAEFEALPHEPTSQIDTIQPIVEQSQADAEVAKSQNTSCIEALHLSQIADVAEAETLPLEPASQNFLAENQNASLVEPPFSSQLVNVTETQIEHIPSIIQQPQANEEMAENQNSRIEIPCSSKIADVVEIEALLNESVSSSMENLEMRSISNEQIVEFTSSSQGNEPICEGVIGAAELSIEGVQNRINASYLYGSGHLPSLNTHSFDPIECELGKTIIEKEEYERSHINMVAQLKSNCEKEMNQIKQKYAMQLQVAEAELRQRRSKTENYQNKLRMNKKLAEAFRTKFTDPGFIGHPLNQQGTSGSVYMQQMQHQSVHPSLRVIANASNFQISTSHSNSSFVRPRIRPHQTLAHSTRFSQITINHSVAAPPVHSCTHPDAGSVGPYIMSHHSCPTRFSTITRHSVTASPVLPVPPTQHMQALFSSAPRPLPVTRPVMPSHNPHASGNVSSMAPPHLQSFRQVGPTTSSRIPPYQSTLQNGHVSQDGLLAENVPHSSTMTLQEMGPWSHLLQENSSSGLSEMRQNYTFLRRGVQGSNTVPGNSSSFVVPDEVVCLSDDD